MLKEAPSKLKKQIPCAHCKHRLLIANVTLYQTHWHVPPRGCCEGDYWQPGECQFVCHHCGTVNRLLFETTYDYSKHENVSAKNDYFESNYKYGFKEIIDTHEDDKLIPKWDIVAATMYMKAHGQLPPSNWVNNYWIDTLEAR